MRRVSIKGAWLWATVGLLGCGQPPSEEDVANAASALINGATALRGFTRTENNVDLHTMLYSEPGSLQLSERTESPFGPTTPHTLPSAATACPPFGYKRVEDGVAAVAYVGTNGDIHELAKVGSANWVDSNFTTSTAIHAASGMKTSVPLIGCEMMAYTRSDQRSTLIYRGQDNHVHEIVSNFSDPGHPWLEADLTQAAAASINVGAYNPVPYVRSDGRNAVVFVGTDQHIHELEGDFNRVPAWNDYDLTLDSGDSARPTSGVWAYKRSDGVNAVLFVGNETPVHQIHELSLNPSFSCGIRRWCKSPLPHTVNPQSSQRPSGYVRADGVSAVVYVTTNSQDPLHELRLVGGMWLDGEMPAVSPTLGTVNSPFGHVAPGNRSSVLYGARANQAPNSFTGVELSLVNGGSAWEASAF